MEVNPRGYAGKRPRAVGTHTTTGGGTITIDASKLTADQLKAIGAIPGPKGDKGDAGLNGLDGHDGKDGADGKIPTSDEIKAALGPIKFPATLHEPELDFADIDSAMKHISSLVEKYGLNDTEIEKLLGYKDFNVYPVIYKIFYILSKLDLGAHNAKAYEDLCTEFEIGTDEKKPDIDSDTHENLRGGATTDEDATFYNPRDNKYTADPDRGIALHHSDNLCVVRAIAQSLSFLKDGTLYHAISELMWPNEKVTDKNNWNKEIKVVSAVTEMFHVYANKTDIKGATKGAKLGMSTVCFFKLLRAVLAGKGSPTKGKPSPTEIKICQTLIDGLEGHMIVWTDGKWSDSPFKSKYIMGIGVAGGHAFALDYRHTGGNWTFSPSEKIDFNGAFEAVGAGEDKTDFLTFFDEHTSNIQKQVPTARPVTENYKGENVIVWRYGNQVQAFSCRCNDACLPDRYCKQCQMVVCCQHAERGHRRTIVPDVPLPTYSCIHCGQPSDCPSCEPCFVAINEAKYRADMARRKAEADARDAEFARLDAELDAQEALENAMAPGLRHNFVEQYKPVTFIDGKYLSTTPPSSGKYCKPYDKAWKSKADSALCDKIRFAIAIHRAERTRKSDIARGQLWARGHVGSKPPRNVFKFVSRVQFLYRRALAGETAEPADEIDIALDPSGKYDSTNEAGFHYRASVIMPSPADICAANQRRSSAAKEVRRMRKALATGTFSIFDFVGGNIGLRLEGAAVGFQRSPAPPGHEYGCVNNTDSLCLVHAYNAQKNPEDRICKHMIGDVPKDGLSIRDFVATGLVDDERFAVWLDGKWAEPTGKYIVGPEDATVRLAAHREPYAHWDALYKAGQRPDALEHAAYTVAGRGCCKDPVMAFRGGSAEWEPEPSAQGNLGQSFSKLFGEPLEYNSRTIEIGGHKDLFHDISLDASVKYGNGTPSVDNIVAAIMNRTFESRETTIKHSATTQSAALTFKFESEFGYVPASIMLDYSNVNGASGNSTVRNMLERRTMAEVFKNAEQQLASVLPMDIDQATKKKIANKLAHYTSTYSDSNIDGWSHIYQRLWSGFLAAATGQTPKANAEVRGHSTYVGNSMARVAQMDPNLQNQDPLPARVPNDRGGAAIWSDAKTIEEDVFDLMRVNSDSNFNAMFLSMRHEANVLEPKVLLNDVAVGGVQPFNHWVVLANVTEPHLGFLPNQTHGHSQFTARYGERLPPFKIVSPFHRSINVGNTPVARGGARGHFDDAPKNETYNSAALGNPVSWLNAIVYLLVNFGHYRNCAAAITFVTKKSFSFFNPVVTTMQTPISSRFHQGQHWENVVRRRLLTMRALAPGGTNPGVDGGVPINKTVKVYQPGPDYEVADHTFSPCDPVTVEVPGEAPAFADAAYFDMVAHDGAHDATIDAWNFDTASFDVDGCRDVGYNTRVYAQLGGQQQGVVRGLFNKICGPGAYQAITAAAIGRRAYHHNGYFNNEYFATDILWFNRFKHCDPGNDDSWRKASSRMTTQEMQHLMLWIRQPFEAVWGNVSAHMATPDEYIDMTAPAATRASGTVRRGAAVVGDDDLEAANLWGDVDRTRSLSMTNTVSNTTHTLPAGFTQMLLVSDGRYLHSRDEQAIAFARSLYRTKPAEVFKVMVLHGCQMRAAVDMATLAQPISASYLLARDGIIATGSKEIDEVIDVTNLSYKRPRISGYFDSWSKLVANALSKIHCVHTDVTEAIAGNSISSFLNPRAWSGKAVHIRRYGLNPDQSYLQDEGEVLESARFLQTVAWRVFHPAIIAALLPGEKSVGGILNRQMECFNRGSSGVRSAIAPMVIDNTTTGYEVLGAKRVYAAGAGVGLNMALRMEYKMEEMEESVARHRDTPQYGYFWSDIMQVAPRMSDQVSFGMSAATDALWWFNSIFEPEAVVGAKYYWKDEDDVHHECLAYTEQIEDYALSASWKVSVAPNLTIGDLKELYIRRQDITGLEIDFTNPDVLAGYLTWHYTPARPIITDITAAHVPVFDPEFITHSSGLIGRRLGGGIEGIKTKSKGNLIRAGLPRDDTISSHMALGPQIIQTGRSTGEQWDHIKKYLYVSWARRHFPISLAGILIWMSESWALIKSPASDFIEPMRAASVMRARSGNFSAESIGSDITLQAPEVEDPTVLREQWALVRPVPLGEGAGQIRGFGLGNGRTYDSILDEVANREREKAEAALLERDAQTWKTRADKLSADKAKLDKDIKTQKATINVLESMIAGSTGTVSELQNDMKKLADELTQLKKELAEKQDEVKAANAEMAELQKQLKAAKESSN
uniref:Coat protein n=1 Tax=Rhizoctonia solani phlegivirus 5 TaxID=3162549 RepID=A0A8F5AG32_9VIRU|nr:hypothetical protein [Rhizoctonia solani dsRNA virus 16]